MKLKRLPYLPIFANSSDINFDDFANLLNDGGWPQTVDPDRFHEIYD